MRPQTTFRLTLSPSAAPLALPLLHIRLLLRGSGGVEVCDCPLQVTAPARTDGATLDRWTRQFSRMELLHQRGEIFDFREHGSKREGAVKGRWREEERGQHDAGEQMVAHSTNKCEGE